MARKSRKPNRELKPVNVNDSHIQTAGYVRLSVKDLDNKGDSIETQKQIIINYIDEHPELQLYDMYVDEGTTGVTFDRPAFNRMIEDAEKGRIGCIIVKDVTRFGRNMIDTGYYVEKHLPSIGIRFISINDEYDSAQNGIDIGFMLKNLVSEAYSLDIRRKVQTVLRHQMNKGDYVGSRPPFGYIKDLNDCHKLVVDEPAADIVRQIYQWACEYKSVPEIVRLLNSQNISTPSHYWFQKGIIENVNLTGNGLWQEKTVSKILSNEVYTGKLVQGKTKVVDNKQQASKSDDLIQVENTHQPIISQELFERTQVILGNRQDRSSKVKRESYSQNLFAGKIFCAHCGARLNRKKNHEHYIYRCLTNYKAPGSCFGNSIREETLFKEVSRLITQYSENMVSSEDISLNTRQIQHELEKLQVELSFKNTELRNLYENFVMGCITDKEYHELINKHRHSISENEQLQKQFFLQQREQKIVEDDWHKLNDALREFKNNVELKQELIDSLVNGLEVYNDGRIFLELSELALSFLP